MIHEELLPVSLGHSSACRAAAERLGNSAGYTVDGRRDRHRERRIDVLSLSDWKVLSYEVSPLTYSPTKAAHEAGFGFSFEAEPYIEYYLWQVVLPLGVVVMMASAAFWFRREDAGVRIGIATSSVLTMIANRFVLSSLLPRLPYMTRLDYLSVGSMLLVFIALFLVVITVFLQTRQKDELARKLDLFSRGSIPAAFALLLGWFLFL